MVFGKAKGYVFINKEIKHSRSPGPGPLPGVNLEEEYFNALQMRLVPVMDIAVDGSSYLVFGKGENSSGFIWDIDKRDTTGEMIPYKLLHPGLDLDDIIEMLRKMQEGKLTEEDLEIVNREAERLMGSWASPNKEEEK